jgi:hypothetical protein
MITLHLSHKENEKCRLKKYIKVVSKWKIKIQTSSSEKIINEVH